MDGGESVGPMGAIGPDNNQVVQLYDFDNLPPHACAYCGIHDPQAVVKCTH